MRSEDKTATDSYTGGLFSASAAQDPDLAESMRRLGKLSAATSETDAIILRFFLQAFAVKSVVEFGTLAGFSAISMARVLPADGHVFTLEANAECARVARENFERAGVADRITLLEGDALTCAKGLAGPYDMVFIDARKREYPAYLDWAERVLRPGGLVVADNAFLKGKVLDDANQDGRTRAMREFNGRMANQSRYISALLPTHDGMFVGILRDLSKRPMSLSENSGRREGKAD